MFNRDDVHKLAELSRMSIPSEDIEEIENDIASVLDYVSLVSEIESKESDVSDHVHRNVLREDTGAHGEGVFTKLLVKEMPDSEKGYLKVKNIL